MQFERYHLNGRAYDTINRIVGFNTEAVTFFRQSKSYRFDYRWLCTVTIGVSIGVLYVDSYSTTNIYQNMQRER